MLTLVLWQHVVFVCVSCTLFRMSVRPNTQSAHSLALMCVCNCLKNQNSAERTERSEPDFNSLNTIAKVNITK